jgi:hypothetical protein
VNLNVKALKAHYQNTHSDIKTSEIKKENAAIQTMDLHLETGTVPFRIFRQFLTFAKTSFFGEIYVNFDVFCW